MLTVKIRTPEGDILLTEVGLSIRQDNTSVYLTPQEYAWLLEYYVFGEYLTIVSEDGAITLLPHIAGALTCLIAGI